MKIAVIGGGASGITAAVSAAKESSKNRITVFERGNRILRKIPATGNGRCNLSNTQISEKNYFSHSPEQLKNFLTAFSANEERQFFNSVGIMLCEENGRLYPYSRRANAVADALRFEAEKQNVNIVCNTFIKNVKKIKNGFIVNSDFFDRVIISSGGSAAPSFGTDGNSFELLSGIGIKCSEVAPALVPIKVCENVKALKGIRVHCKMALVKNGISVRVEDGELQFTDYGLSGIGIMQFSRLAEKGAAVEVDLVPSLSEDALFNALSERKHLLKNRSSEDFLTGIIHKTLAVFILKRVGISPALSVEELSDMQLKKLADIMKSLRFTVHSALSWESAQVTCGGAYLTEFNNKLEALNIPGLYCCGEALDVVGDCGGYNLHWAWLSGIVAGKNAGRE